MVGNITDKFYIEADVSTEKENEELLAVFKENQVSLNIVYKETHLDNTLYIYKVGVNFSNQLEFLEVLSSLFERFKHLNLRFTFYEEKLQ